MRRLWRATIWYPGAIPITEGELARDVKRWVLPAVDLILIFGSMLAISHGMPTFAIIYNAVVSHFAAVAILIFSIGCLIGVAIPKLWLLELIAKCGLAFVLITYASLLLGRVLIGDSTGGFVGAVALALSVVPIWRIVWLGREYRRRNARKGS